MGGKLQVESKINGGSTFKFVLAFEIPTQMNNQDIITFTTFDNLRVLLAEDNRINMLVAKKQLEKWGIQVDEAENGEVAYNKFLNSYYDVVLMDMEMPVMDGLTATGKIRETNKEIPIMALTAASFENMHDFLIEKGLNGFIKKPFSPIELNKKIFDAVNTTIDGKVLRSSRVSAMVG
jgi:CheY-like chemotaxis protein